MLKLDSPNHGPRISDPFWLRAGKAVTDLVIALAVVFLAASLVRNQSLDGGGRALWAFVLPVAIVVRVCLSRFALDLIWRPDATVVEPAADDSTDQLVKQAEETFLARHPDGVILLQLIGLLLDPRGYFERIKETISIQDTWYESTTTMTFLAPVERESLVPIVVQRKKLLIDSMQLSINGSSASTLSYVENQGAILSVLSAIYTSIQPDDDDGALLARIKRCVASPDLQRSDLIVDEINNLAPPTGTALNVGAWKRILADLVELGAHSYFLLAIVQPDKDSYSTKIAVSRTFVPLRVAGQTGFSPRNVVGLNSREHVFSLQRATETTSYHLSIDAPEGMYIYRRKFSDIEVPDSPASTMPVSPIRRALVPDQVESASDQHLHVYLRDHVSDAASTSTAYLGISLRERPPALMEAGLLLSCYLVMTVWTVGAYHDRIFGTSPPPGTWPTVLFGIPTLLSGWLVTRFTYDTLKRMSLVSLVMTIWLAVNSGLAVFAAAFKSSDVRLTDKPRDFLFLHLEHPVWGTLMLVTALHLALSVVFVLGRAGRYGWTLRPTVKSTNKGK